MICACGSRHCKRIALVTTPFKWCSAEVMLANFLATLLSIPAHQPNTTAHPESCRLQAVALGAEMTQPSSSRDLTSIRERMIFVQPWKRTLAAWAQSLLSGCPLTARPASSRASALCSLTPQLAR